MKCSFAQHSAQSPAPSPKGERHAAHSGGRAVSTAKRNAARTGAKMREGVRVTKNKSRDGLLPVSETPRRASLPENPDLLIAELRTLTWERLGIVREGAGLKAAVARLEEMKRRLPPAASRRAREARNLHTCAALIARSALARLESRGAHYRTDYPAHDDARFRKHTVLEGEKVAFAAITLR